MNPVRVGGALFLVAATTVFLIQLSTARRAPTEPPEGAETRPSEWFAAQRAYPGAEIPQAAWRIAVEQALAERAALALGTSSGVLTWELAGPTNIGGRVTAIASHTSGAPAYFGAANGGVFRSTDFGATWAPIFDALGVPSIGALAIDPANAAVLYVGTGEANGAVDNYDGNGLYRTRDGGVSWEHLGLAATARIARVAVDPADPARIYVAAMGSQFSTSPDRGLYRSTNSGATWTKVLFVNDSTGVTDVVVNPAHPDTVWCATWERVRRPSYRRAYGPGCGIWRSIDRGATWSRMTAGLPVPSDSTGRIGLAVARSRPSWVYAQITGGLAYGYTGRGMYRSTDGGTTWARRDVSGFHGGFGGFGWYFGDCAVDPLNPNRVFALGVGLMRSNDGGASFSSAVGIHPDQHALWFSPTDPTKSYLGNDGGLWTSPDQGATWSFVDGLPITQFYAGTIDPSNPQRLLGGTQDNYTLMTHGPAGAWQPILDGDGFYCRVHPTNPNLVYAEWQNACNGSGPRRSTDGGASFTGPTGFVSSDRYNWSAPFTLDPNAPSVMIAGSQRVYRSLNGGASYTPVSGDLTFNQPASLVYHTISTLDISPADGAFFLAGTDDGRVWRSTDAGGSWFEISAGLPRRWVSRVVADPVSPAVCYVTLSGFTLDESVAHVFRSSDRGVTWSSIGSNLPDVPVNDLVVDPDDPNTLIVGTDVGVWASRNRGGSWFPLGQGLPVQVVSDLTLHAPSRTLVAATHGRSQWRLDLSALPTAVDAASAARIGLRISPNPARTTALVELDLDVASETIIAVHDVLGRRIRSLASGALSSGRHRFTWDGRDDAGRAAAPGTYFVRARAGGAALTRRIVRVL